MVTEIKDGNGQLKKSEIEELENNNSLQLPPTYRTFLETFNGGYPDPDGFSFIDSDDGSSVDRFLGINVGKHSNLEKYLKIYEGRLPKGLFPIAHDPGGNLILIGIEEPIRGKVFFWDHEKEVDSGAPDMSNVYPVANSFEDFLNELHEYEI